MQGPRLMVGLLVTAGAVAGCVSPPPPLPPLQTGAPAVASTSNAPMGQATAFGAAGTYQVGSDLKDIAPGTYTTRGSSRTAAQGENFCSWFRLRSRETTGSSVIADGDAGSGGSFTVMPTDKFVRLDGECLWVRS